MSCPKCYGTLREYEAVGCTDGACPLNKAMQPAKGVASEMRGITLPEATVRALFNSLTDRQRQAFEDVHDALKNAAPQDGGIASPEPVKPESRSPACGAASPLSAVEETVPLRKYEAMSRLLTRSVAGECLKCGMGPLRESCAYPEDCEHPGRELALKLNQCLLSSARVPTGEAYLCRASGEGSHNFRICADVEAVASFYKEMFGEDQGGGIDSFYRTWRDDDEWSGDAGSRSLRMDLYCARFEVWQADPAELSCVASARGEKA